MTETIWTIKSLLDWSVGYFHKKGIENARLNAEWLLGETLQMDRIQLYLNFEKVMNKNELTAYRQVVEKRKSRVPLQYILGHFEFMGLDLNLNPGVLIPRPETELLVEEGIQLLKKKRTPVSVLEIGVGSGCIPVSMAHFLSNGIRYYGIDVSEEAVNLAKENCLKHDCNGETLFHRFDFLSGLPEELTEKQFDLIISNPPYVTEEEWINLQPEVRDNEPKVALVPPGNNPLIFYEKLAKLENNLSENGYILVEINSGLADETKNIFETAGFQVSIKKDYSRKDRILVATMRNKVD